MQHKLHHQLPTTQPADNLLAAIVANAASFDTLRVASAYATVEGVVNLYNGLITVTTLQKIDWLIGLDDAFTYPGALESCQSKQGATLKVAKFAPKRFHPKIYLLTASGDASRAVLIVGSSNLTKSALTLNGEASAILTAQTSTEVDEFIRYWDNYWNIGTPLTPTALSKYKADYKQAEKKRRAAGLSPPGIPVGGSVTDTTLIDPSLATVAWIEVGNITGGGTQLEIKGSMADFFSLPISGVSKQTYSKNFLSSNGKVLVLNFNFRVNEMWRLQLTNGVPEMPVRVGKPRSTKVAVFEKSNGVIKLSFPDIISTRFKNIRKKSVANGFQGKTSAREYGWY